LILNVHLIIVILFNEIFTYKFFGIKLDIIRQEITVSVPLISTRMELI